MSYVIDAVKDRPRILCPNFQKSPSEKAKLAAAKANHKAALRAHFGSDYKKHINITAPIYVRNSF